MSTIRCTSSTRPAHPPSDTRVVEEDTGWVLEYDGHGRWIRVSTVLIEFLRARFDDTEQKARAIHARTCGHDDVDPDAPCNCDWHVSFMLREVEAKRRILDLHGPLQLPATNYRPAILQCEYCASLCHSRSGLGCDTPIDAPWPCDTVRLLALPYADHPDYRPEWAVTP